MKKVKAVFRGIVIFLLCIIEIYPLFWMLTASFKKQAEWSEKPAYALNDGFYFQNYSDAWTMIRLLLAVRHFPLLIFI